MSGVEAHLGLGFLYPHPTADASGLASLLPVDRE